MDQNEVFNQLKSALNDFPQFLKSLVKKPLDYIDRDTQFMWSQIILFTFLVEAITNVIYNVLIMNFSGVPSSLIFFPIQTLVVIGFIAFIIGFICDKMGFTQISFFNIFKLLCFAEMIVHIFVLPVLIVMVYVRSVEFIYAVQAIVVLAKAYLVYRGLSTQFHMASKRAFGIVALFAIFFLVPTVTGYTQGYHNRKEAKHARQLHEEQMEKSIEEIEKDLGHADPD